MSEPIRVLVVDDQALVRAGFTMILNSEDDIEDILRDADGVARQQSGASGIDANKKGHRMRCPLVDMTGKLVYLPQLGRGSGCRLRPFSRPAQDVAPAVDGKSVR